MAPSAVRNVKARPLINHARDAEKRDRFSRGIQQRVTELSPEG